MVNRTLATLVMLIACGIVLSYTGAHADKGGAAKSDIAALQAKRIGLLRERVSKILEYHEAKLVDRTVLIESQIDLINAQLEYAGSNGEKRQLFTKLMEKYDEQIRLAELILKAPASPPQAGKRPQPHGPVSRLLLYKSERIRLEIERDRLAP